MSLKKLNNNRAVAWCGLAAVFAALFMFGQAGAFKEEPKYVAPKGATTTDQLAIEAREWNDKMKPVRIQEAERRMKKIQKRLNEAPIIIVQVKD